MARNPYYAGPASDHFDGTIFFLPGLRPATNRRDMLRWQLNRQRAKWPRHFPSPHHGARPDARVRGLRVTLIGHASFLLQAANTNILIDPVWSDRASPLSFLGPRRVNPPGIAFDHLPPIDVVLLTHNHYDHMDLRTLGRLHTTHTPIFISPLGNDRIIRARHRRIAVQTFDWHERIDLAPNLAVTLLPAQHWSARGLRDRRMALWGSFLFHTPAGTIYHVGDTGYGDGATFRAIRERYGAPDLAILPIGAYEPRWFMHQAHMNPAEAVLAMRDIGAPIALGHHWGTFQLTDEPVDQPERDLAAARAAFNLHPHQFPALRPGETWSPS